MVTSVGVVFQATGLSKRYRMGEIDVWALRGVDLELQGGEFVVWLGPSGSGKSTLLNILGGLDVPTSGTVRFLDHDLTVDDDAELTRFRREHVGFVFQFYNLIPSLTALDNVALVTEIADHPLDPVEALRLVGLEARLHHFLALPCPGSANRPGPARIHRQGGRCSCLLPLIRYRQEKPVPVIGIRASAPESAGWAGEVMPPGVVEWIASRVNPVEALARIHVQLGAAKRKTAAGAAKGSDDRYLYAFEGSLDELALVDPKNGRLLDVNPTFVQRSGYSRTQLLGGRIEQYDAALAPEQRSELNQKLVREGRVQYRIKISSFLDNDVLSIQVWERAIKYFNDNQIPGVILDLRNNGGGSGWLADQMAAYFFDKEIVVGNSAQYSKATGEFYMDPGNEAIMIPPRAELQYSGPVVVMVGPNCASACEIFSYNMTINNRAVIVGQYPSEGAGGSVEDFLMPEDITVQLTIGRAVGVDGTIHLEGTGVVPDVRVPVTLDTLKKEANGEDVVLAAAEKVISQR